MTKSFPWVLLWTTPPLVLPFFPSVFPEEWNSAEVYSTGGWEVRFYGSHCWNDSLPLIHVFQLSTHFLSPLLKVGEHSEGARLGSEVSKIKGRPTECVRVFGRCSVIIQDSIYVDVLWFCCWVTAQGVWGDGKVRKSLFDQLCKVSTVARGFTLRELLLEDCCCWWLTDVDYVKNQGEYDC